MFLLFSAFIAGMLTVLAPCVLALLPIIIGGSVSGDTKDRKRPVIIALSLAASLLFFTLLLKATTLLIDIPPKSITYFSGGIIVALGIVVLFPSLYAKLIAKLGVEHRAQKALSKGFSNKREYIGPIVTGAALGPVFASCSPVYAYILATVLPANFAQALVYIISYIIGLSVILLAIGYYGQKFVSKIKFASDPKGLFQRVIAILFIVTGLLIISGYDKRLQVYISAHTPFNFDALNSKLLPKSKNEIDNSKLFNVKPYDAPEFVGLKSWINSKPLTKDDLKGKVVMIDFWTYSCINCIRNNPHIEALYQAYKDDGLVVIGMHAPEFAFEKIPANVQKGVKDQKLTYPVALDNDLETWNAFYNRSWPASYLINPEGKIVRVHEGEGQYMEAEEAVRSLLKANGATLSDTLVEGTDKLAYTPGQTPETYLGTSRASNYSGTPSLGSADIQDFVKNNALPKNGWSLSGKWEVQEEKIIARGGSKLQFRIASKEVYLVGGSPNGGVMEVSLDGKPIGSTTYSGKDVSDSKVNFGPSQLYRLVSYPKFTDGQILELSVPDGAELNAFTFGS